MSEKIKPDDYAGTIISTRMPSSEEACKVADLLVEATGNGAIIYDGRTDEVLAASTPEGARIAQKINSSHSMSDLKPGSYETIFHHSGPKLHD